MGSILYIRKSPPRGGDTLFASMNAAFEALSDRMKRYLEGLTAMHDGEDAYRGTYAAPMVSLTSQPIRAPSIR